MTMRSTTIPPALAGEPEFRPLVERREELHRRESAAFSAVEAAADVHQAAEREWEAEARAALLAGTLTPPRPTFEPPTSTRRPSGRHTTRSPRRRSACCTSTPPSWSSGSPPAWPPSTPGPTSWSAPYAPSRRSATPCSGSASNSAAWCPPTRRCPGECPAWTRSCSGRRTPTTPRTSRASSGSSPPHPVGSAGRGLGGTDDRDWPLSRCVRQAEHVTTARTRREAAALLRRLLAAVEAGELAAEEAWPRYSPASTGGRPTSWSSPSWTASRARSATSPTSYSAPRAAGGHWSPSISAWT